MMLHRHWENLSPNAKRVAALGGGVFVVSVLTAGSFLFAPAQPPGLQSSSPRDTLVRNILTDADPRQLGIEALVNRLERMEKRMSEVQRNLERGATAAPNTPALGPAQREQDLGNARELEVLRGEIDQLREALAARARPTANPPGLPQPEQPVAADPASPAGTAAQPHRPAPMEALFGPPTAPLAVPGAAPSSAVPAQTPGRTLQIRTVAAPASSAPPAATPPGTPEPGSVYIPAGAILKGVLLNGIDMPTGQNARKDPVPALIRVKHQAILPNRVRADLRECFLLVGGFGDLASERAYLRGETFSCIRNDGGVIEIPIDGYAVGEDGKVGVRGRVVSKQGVLLAKALQAGFLQSFSQIFNRMPSIPVNTGTGTDLQFQSMLTPQALSAASAQGVGGAMDRLANYYLDMAEQLLPVIEVDAGRGAEFILNRGVSMKLADVVK
ncbi:TrbI/VirB10 family protein [Thiocapsa bogorovii]|uniref:TrbI/VirB10 family protein n=1 Tax=Thiocapsa bogorovii TaxID=521689 RepID=UPI001E5D356B|nr:TrbI/VirB10 family protein [Thiocapsa bogorovii]UHD15047.1 conjugal transfer protein TraB [Thiocapsa bogorovii]